MMLALITGYDDNRLIGNGIELPWKIADDLKNFRQITSGTTVIMGYTTFQSIGKPLPNRNNIVLYNGDLQIEGAYVCHSIPEAIEKAKEFKKDIFVMGGASIYRQFLPLVDKLYISHIHGKFIGDIYFPEYDTNEWIEEHRKKFPEFDFVIYKRKHPLHK
ncbi:MAG: Dihydrofolate reductase [Candidatus Woesebacteria bacterium GW2011_GWA1_38_8]|uniref:Dihydrofolate reductase n=1 Tax=Candidatus Woesebacteria bacterium GW2011_GWA1_38_8 TaxID=1618547 RepID=A0A0G0KWR3_9BACT|nr:MAG: Dihydrofolate reductase [Candidatus Woesebacteria bacterium GW2011_GWA1_38_8]